jgi:hypothetical protein
MTNPDNAGGLPATGPFVDRLIRIFRDKPHDDTSALVLLEYGELCRAAPAGGDAAVCGNCDGSGEVQTGECVNEDDYGKRTCPECDGTGRDSAPAGSGEVEALVQKWRDESESGFDGDGNLSDTWTAQAKRVCADELTALLRKLKQGADYVMVPREPTSKMAALGAIAHKERGMAAAYRAMIAASQGQEGGNE